MRLQPSISASRVALGVIIGFFLLVAVQIAFAGTLFDENGNKVTTCKGSTCAGSGSGGSDGVAVPNVTVNQKARTASKANAAASAKSRSTSRSRSSSSATAQGGSASAIGGGATTTVTSNPSQTTSVSVQSGSGGGTDLSKMVPDVYAPGLTTSGDDMCVGSASGGLTLSGVGALFGMTTRDSHCRMIKGTKLLMQAGMTDAALRRMCMDDEMREAIGDQCPERKQEPSPSRSSSFIH